MITVTSKTRATVAALAMAASFGASATPITLTDITGIDPTTGAKIPGAYKVWAVDPAGAPNVLVATDYTSPSSAGFDAAKAALGGNPATPGGNVELSKFGGPVTVLSGTADGHTVTMSSLVLTDWTANSNALAISYIQDAATAAFGSMLTPAQLTVALGKFFSLNIGGHKPWQLVSDPNISYVDITGDKLSFGLAGLLDASPFLSAISGIPLKPGKQASEVVKVSFDGAAATYHYGFHATPSGVHAADGVSYAGNFPDPFVPEPAGLALFGLGLVSLLLTRRRR